MTGPFLSVADEWLLVLYDYVERTDYVPETWHRPQWLRPTSTTTSKAYRLQYLYLVIPDDAVRLYTFHDFSVQLQRSGTGHSVSSGIESIPIQYRAYDDNTYSV